MFFRGRAYPFRRRVFCAAIFCLWLAAGTGRAASPVLPARRNTPAAPVYSMDGAVVVYAPTTKAGYRMPVLIFVNQWRDELQRVLRLKLGSQACLLEVAIGGKSDGDKRVLTVRLQDAGGGVRERIELPDPEAADLEAFRRAICVALLRAWMVDAGGTAATMRDVPVWLVDGVLRYMNRDMRQADVDRTLRLWSRACLPPAGGLLAFDSAAATRETAVAAVLASWFLEKRQEGSVFETLLRRAATGSDWSAERAGQLLAGTNDLCQVDAYVDGRMLAETHVVTKPGLTTEGIVRRFRSHLLLYPAFYDKTWGHNEPWCSFQEAVARSTDPDVRASAALLAPRVKLAAIGRDGMFLALAEAYTTFLEALAHGESQAALSQLLEDAEGMRRTLELKTSRGAVSQRGTQGD